MEDIVGSSYNFRFWEDEYNETVTFERLKEPLRDGARSYVSPDREDMFVKGMDGLYRHP